MKVRKNKPELFICSLLPALILIIFLTTGCEPRVFATNKGSRYHRETCSSLRVSAIKITLKEAIRRDQARIFHTVSTAASQSGMSTALRLFGLLDILCNMPSSPSLRAPCIHAHLRRLATKSYEISGLKPCGICNPPTFAPETRATPVVANNRSTQSGGAPKTVSSTGAHSVEPYRVNQHRLKTSSAADFSLMSRAKVTGHVDGDTVKVRIYNPPAGINELETVRMLGVDAPETKHPSKPVEYFGKEASEFTRKALLNKQVFLAFDFDLRDRYGRLLAYIYTSREQCFNAKLIYEGYAHAYVYFPFQFMGEFRRLEQEARKAKRGLWASPDISP